jgi:cation-transporting P-type ATPase E
VGYRRAVVETEHATRGLTTAEVATRVANAQVNRTDDRSSRTLGDIVRANVLTRFNAIVATLGAIVLVLGDPRDALFALVMVSNAVIGTAQEWRSKRTLDRLSLVSTPSVRVWRDAAPIDLAPSELVIDDVFELTAGDQIAVDAAVVQTSGMAVDESLLTGEADAVAKATGDGVLSGSFVVAGGGLARATAVGDDAYAAQLASEARQFRRPRSELARGIDRILQVITWLVVPVAIVLFGANWIGEHQSWRESLVGSVAGVVALVPQGLVLLLSMAQAVAVIRLGRDQVLVQQLQAVETLARVTVLATDKTGTLTTGAVSLVDVRPAESSTSVDHSIDDVLASVAAADEHPNATMAAIAAAYPRPPGWTVDGRIPFDSAHKYSAIEFAGRGAWYVGAPEVLVGPDSATLHAVSSFADEGMRVLLLAGAPSLGAPGEIPDGLEPVATVVLADDVRPDAADTIAYFRREHVDLKVISGDNPRTVAAIAARCGVPGGDRWVDARSLADDDAIGAAMIDTAVFGRVTPHVKRSLVHAAQRQGEVVAMTGDGVNDTLALKDADLGIAMGSGTPAAKSVAELVLLDDRFATLPGVVAEGRRVIANIERVARLFVTKTAWAAVLAVLTGVFTISYPILPRQLTVVDALTIGIPGFVLSFQPSHEPARSGFLPRVLRFALPAGAVVGVATFAVFAACRSDVVGASREQAQSAATLVLVALGLWVLYELARPLDRIRTALLAGLVAGGVGAFTIPFVADFFSLSVPSGDVAATVAIGVAAALPAITLAIRRFDDDPTRRS